MFKNILFANFIDTFFLFGNSRELQNYIIVLSVMSVSICNI